MIDGCCSTWSDSWICAIASVEGNRAAVRKAVVSGEQLVGQSNRRYRSASAVMGCLEAPAGSGVKVRVG